MSKKPGEESVTGEGPWDQFQRQAAAAWQDWSQQLPPVAPNAGADWAERIRAGLDGYYGWLGQVGAVPGGTASTADSGHTAEAPPWQAWLDAIQRGDFQSLQSLLLQTPGLGGGRVEQERQQALIAAWIEYLAASQAYEAMVRDAQIKGGDLLRQRLQRLAAEQASFDSLRQLYDEWVDSAEAAYMDAALSAEFSRVYGVLVNAQVKLRELQRAEVERQARAWGLPVSAEVEALTERVESLRRELRLSERRLSTLEAQCASLLAMAAEASSAAAGQAAAGRHASTPKSKPTPRRSSATPNTKPKPALKTAPARKATAKPATKSARTARRSTP